MKPFARVAQRRKTELRHQKEIRGLFAFSSGEKTWHIPSFHIFEILGNTYRVRKFDSVIILPAETQ